MPSMKPILALETTTRTGSVAILLDQAGGPRFVSGELNDEAGHGQRLLPLVDDLLRQAGLARTELGLVAFGQGPGAFTGIRLGCSAAQGIGFALGLPVVAVNALQACAAAFDEGSAIKLVALDARMQEVYFAAYGPQGLELQAPVLLAAGDVPKFIAPRLTFWRRALGQSGGAEPLACLVGEGWQVVQAAVDKSWQTGLGLRELDDQARPHAKEVAQVASARWQAGQVLKPEQALPLYLRNKVAFTTEERAIGLGGNPKVSQPDEALLLPMMPVDLNEVVELESQSQAFPWSRRNFEDALAARYPASVLRLEGQLVGFCVAMPTPDDVHLLVIAVSPDHRRQGLGAKLVVHVQALAREQGVSRVILEVRPSNTRALAFYKKLGFEQIGARKGYYPAGKGEREDALVLARELE